ncbi:MAG: Thymidylate synthase ThyX [Nitrosomonadaceae bacterium]|nr:Thymidylate synthase ThyX [Nitrosomonadaceae bacterium]
MPVRELESVEYTFEFLLDYGAYRELKRHRMMSYIAQPATVTNGYLVPDLIEEAGLTGDFNKAMDVSQQAFDKIYRELPNVAPYVTTHAHLRRVICKMNLRECYHLFKLRTGPDAHFTLRRVMTEAMEQGRQVHPLLFKHLRLR